LGQNARAARQHRAVSAICLTPGFRAFSEDGGNIQHPTSNINIQLAEPEEIAAGQASVDSALTLEAVGRKYRPNFLCNYLYELAGKFTSFYRKLSGAQGR